MACRENAICRRLRDPILRLIVERLAKAYGFLWALRDISLELVPGEMVSLLGPNGAGKTTLLKLLSGLTAPTAGHIRLDDDRIAAFAPQTRGRIGLLAPADHLYDHLTAEENLRFFLELYHRREALGRINSALRETGLGERAHDYAGNLSSGLRCRLSIAKWRLLEPGLLLLDEPYGVLDGSGVDLLEAFLKDHCARGNIAVMASHHVSRALHLCSRALILHRGKLTFNERQRRQFDPDDLTVPSGRFARISFVNEGDNPHTFVIDDLTETSVDVKLDTHVYKAIGVSDEEMTLDIVNALASV